MKTPSQPEPASAYFPDDFLTQLKQGQESLEFALQSGCMGTWDIDLEHGTMTCSKEMLDLWGIDSEEFKGQRSVLHSRVHPEDFQKMTAAIDSAIHNRSVYELEYRICPSPGIEKWVKAHGRCTFLPGSNDPARFAGVVYDITEKKIKEEALSSAIKAREKFFLMAGHELRTPLACLDLQISVMEWDLKNIPGDISKEKLELFLKKQREHLLRITRTVNNIITESEK